MVAAWIRRLGNRARFTPYRAAAACMLGPVAYEWLRQRPDVDPLRDAGLRLVQDASHGSGVLVSAVRARSVALLRPEVRLPWARRPITTHSDRWPHVRWG